MWPFYISGGAALIAVLIFVWWRIKGSLPKILMIPLIPFVFPIVFLYMILNPKERKKIDGGVVLLFFVVLYFYVVIIGGIILIYSV